MIDTLYTEATQLINGYQLCEGCGEVLVTGGRVMVREDVNGRYYAHPLCTTEPYNCEDGYEGHVRLCESSRSPALSLQEWVLLQTPATESYRSEKQHTEMELFPHSTREMYGRAE